MSYPSGPPGNSGYPSGPPATQYTAPTQQFGQRPGARQPRGAEQAAAVPRPSPSRCSACSSTWPASARCSPSALRTSPASARSAARSAPRRRHRPRCASRSSRLCSPASACCRSRRSSDACVAVLAVLGFLLVLLADRRPPSARPSDWALYLIIAFSRAADDRRGGRTAARRRRHHRAGAEAEVRAATRTASTAPRAVLRSAPGPAAARSPAAPAGPAAAAAGYPAAVRRLPERPVDRRLRRAAGAAVAVQPGRRRRSRAVRRRLRRASPPSAQPQAVRARLAADAVASKRSSHSSRLRRNPPRHRHNL